MSDIHCTTKLCSKCQTETARTSSGQCKPCKKAFDAAYHAANSEARKAYCSAYRTANSEALRAYDAACYAANPEMYKAAGAAYRAANPEARKATNAIYRAANPEKSKAYRDANSEMIRTYGAAYRTANLEACRINSQNYKAKKRANGGTLSKGVSEKLFKLQQGKCPCCNEPLGENYHLDHIMPIHLGGPNIDSNMQLLRKICNLQKAAQHPIDFMQGRGFLL